jgi:hypothetical protein
MVNTPQPGAVHASLPTLLHLLLAVAGALLLWMSSPWGVWVSPDSAEYIAAARRLTGPADLFNLPTQWAPGYPVLLALAYLFGDDIFATTRLLQCVLLAANIGIGIALLRHVMGRDGLLPVSGGLVLLVSATLWQVNFYAWSEAPFLLCLQGSALALLRHVESGTRGTFVAAVALAAMALLFRYAGIAWVGAAALTLLLLQAGSWQQRLRKPVLFGLVALAPFVLWLLLNQLVRQETTNREFVVHLVSGTDLLALLQQFAAWLGFQQGWLPFVVQTALVAMVVGKVVQGPALPSRLRSLLVLAGVMVGGYTLFILFSKSFLDAYIPFDDRIFAPAWIFALLALLACLLQLAPAPQTQLLAALALMAVAGGNVLALWPGVTAARSQGIGYLSAYMSSVSRVEEVPELARVTVYTNAPDYLRMRTDFTIHDYPRKYAPTTGLANAAYASDAAFMEKQVREGKAVLAHYNGFEWRAYFPTLAELNESGYVSVLAGNGVQLLALPAAVNQ